MALTRLRDGAGSSEHCLLANSMKCIKFSRNRLIYKFLLKQIPGYRVSVWFPFLLIENDKKMNEHSVMGAARSNMQVTLGENENNDLSKSPHSRTKYKFSRSQIINNLEYIGVAPITQYTHVRNKIVTLNGAHLIW